jgi:hypothetical protein
MIEIVNPIKQHRSENWIEATKQAAEMNQARLEGFIRATELAIDYNRAYINWAKKEIAWSKENKETLSYAVWYGQWAQEELAAYETELKKCEAHLEDLQKRLVEIDQ